MKQILLLKGKTWIGKLFGDARREASPDRPAPMPSPQEVRPVGPARTALPAGNGSLDSGRAPAPGVGPGPDCRKPASPNSEDLRRAIESCAILRRSVESEMQDLCKTYRKSMPPCRLQLYARASESTNLPRRLYWVRLFRARNVFDHATLGPLQKKRPRWFKRLRIRTRSDLHAAIHWSGLDKHHRTVMSFYERCRALNESRSILASAMHGVKCAFRSHLGASGSVREDILPALEELCRAHAEGPGLDLVIMAWQFERLVEPQQRALEELQKRMVELPLRFVWSPDPTDPRRPLEWENAVSGRRSRIILHQMLRSFRLPPHDLAALRAAVGEARVLARTLSRRLGMLNRAECGLALAARRAKEILGRCAPVEVSPWIPGY